jgi:Holliday junction resolvase RusA-like endonuclease
MEQLLNERINIEPYTWGSKRDSERRERIRELIRQQRPDYESFVSKLVNEYTHISVTIRCHLAKPETKDIDNLSKIPIDALFYSAKGEEGHKCKWEAKIDSLSIKKVSDKEQYLEIIIEAERSQDSRD